MRHFTVSSRKNLLSSSSDRWTKNLVSSAYLLPSSSSSSSSSSSFTTTTQVLSTVSGSYFVSRTLSTTLNIPYSDKSNQIHHLSSSLFSSIRICKKISLSSLPSSRSTSTTTPTKASSSSSAPSSSKSSGSSSSVPPPGSRAAAVFNAAVAGTYDATMLKEDMDRSSSSSSASTVAPTLSSNPYVPTIEYTGNYYTRKTNPIEHDWAQAGRYYDLGSKDDIKKIFPQGLAGDIVQEWSVTGMSSMLIRPVGVQMVKHFENWRQTHGRQLAKDGKKVLDIDANIPYTSTGALNPPSTREELLSSNNNKPSSSSKKTKANTPVNETKIPSLWSKFHPLRVLVGPQGSGKSALLNYNVHYARRNNWIVLFVQDSYEIMNMGKVLVPSKRCEGMVDQHDMALKILKEFLAASEPLLVQVNQRGLYAKHRYLPSKLDKTVSSERSKLRDEEEAEKSRLKAQADAAGRVWDPSTFKSIYEDESDTKIDRSTFTLKDMVVWGITHPSSATDTLLDVIKELKQVTEFPVMIAVDGINEMYGPSPYPEAGTGEFLPATRLSLPAALQCLGTEGFKPEAALKRGLWLTNVSFKHSQNMNDMFNSVSVRGRLRVPVPSLSRQEIFSTLNYFVKSNGFLMLDGVKTIDPFLVEYYRMLTDGNPKDMFMAAIFTPDVPKGPRPRNYREREGY